jgi:anthranilate phosphoribosyltransferase
VRLAIVREISQDEMRGKTMRSYESSLRAAQEEELRMTGSEKEAEIIRRHMAGEYCRRRCVKNYTREEIKFMAESAMHTEDNEAGG